MVSEEQFTQMKSDSIASLRGKTDTEAYLAMALTLSNLKKTFPDISELEYTTCALEIFAVCREAARQDAMAELTVAGMQ